jgi:RNA ligase
MDNIIQLIEDGYLMCQKHPTEDLWIYNYTAKCQYERIWCDITLSCRGRIIDKDGQVVAVPFRKDA